AHIPPRAIRLRATRYGRTYRSLLQTCLQLEHGAADPALHGAERHLHAAREVLVCVAVEKGAAQRHTFMRCKGLETTVQFFVLLRALQSGVGASRAVSNVSRGVDRFHVAAST